MKVFALVAILPILVQAGPVIPRSCDSATGRHNACLMYREELHSRQFGDLFGSIGDLFGGGENDNGGGGGFGDIVDTVGGLFGGGDNDNNANGGGGGLGNIIDTVGGLFGGNNDNDNAASANAGANNNAGGGLGNIIDTVGGLFGSGNDNANANNDNNNGGGLNNIVNAVGGLINGGNDNNANGGNGGLGNVLNTVGGLLGGGDNANANTGANAGANAGAAAAQQAPPAAQQAPPAQVAPAQQAPPAATTPPAVDDAADVDPAATANNGAQCSAALPGINQATVNVIQEFEGFEDVPRPDPIGLPTAGFGHLCQQRNCAEVTAAGFTFPLSQEEGVQLLQNDIGQFTRCLNDMINDSVVLNESQFGALTSFTFNLGCRTVQRSTLMRRLNAGENPNTVAAQEMPKFRLANGRVFNGLVRRRAAEVALFQSPSNNVALPVCN